MIVKPSELTPLAVAAAVDGWREIGAPPVFTYATGAAATGTAVVDNVDFVQFTGSTRTGRTIAQRAAGRLIPYIVSTQVRDAVSKGARILTGGNATDDGFGFEPTVLVEVDHTMMCMREETFGPLLPVMRVRDADEAVRLANDTDYGLSASIWSRSSKRANEIADRLDVGSVDVNDVQTHLACFPVAQAGWKQSGIGSRLGGAHGIRKYCRTRSVVTPAVDISLVAQLAFFPYSPFKSRIVDTTFRFIGGHDLRRRLGL